MNIYIYISLYKYVAIHMFNIAKKVIKENIEPINKYTTYLKIKIMDRM